MLMIPTAKAVVAKNIRMTTLTGEPVTVICDPATVRSYLEASDVEADCICLTECYRSQPTWGSHVGMVFSSQLQLGESNCPIA